MADDGDDDTFQQLRGRFDVIRRRLDADLAGTDSDNEGYQEDDKKRIHKSTTAILLHAHELLKRAMTGLLWLSTLALYFFAVILAWLVVAYTKDITDSPEALKEQLSQIWTVLSGAFIVVFFQFIANMGKRISSNGSENS